MDTEIRMQPGWEDLFRTNNSPEGRTNNSRAGSVVHWRVLRRRSKPLLVLPKSGLAAARSLELYPAQTKKARFLKKILGWVLPLNLPLPLERAQTLIDPTTPFARFLTEQAGTKEFPRLGILAGNPRTHGRRFILLLFGKKNQPVCIVKAGIGKKAMQLIQRGQDAMISLPGSAAGIPKLFGTFHGENLSAFAMEFLDGESPSVANAGMVISLLNSWVQEKHNVILGETALWGEMAAVGSLSPLRSRLEALQTRPVRPVIWHGDFTPWNMKLDRRTQRCTVFDWERGHLPGVPGWDWFHFVIQSSALVKNLSAAAMRDELEQLFRSEIFSAYAARCGIAGCERELVLAYLLYDLEVRKPVEGAKEIRALLELLTESWTTDSKS